MKRNRLITSFFHGSSKPPKSDQTPAEGTEISDKLDNKDQPSTPQAKTRRGDDGAACGNACSVDETVGCGHDLDADDTDVGLPSKKAKSTSVWRESWLNLYPWLQKPENGKGMQCKLCLQAGKSTPFSTEKGCTNYKTSTLMRHVRTANHQDAVKEVTLRADLHSAVSNAVTNKQEAVKVAMKAVYWLAKEAVATDKFSSLLDLLNAAGCKSIENLRVGNVAYRSHTTAEEMQQAIAESIRKDMIDKIQNSEFFSILTDESTDISTTGRLVLYIRNVTENFNVESHFVGNVHLVEKDALSITTKLLKSVEENGLDTRKMVGLGSDGASVMVGTKNGVSAKLKDVNPFLINIHCVAHRLALCTSQAASSVDYLKEYKDILTSLFYYFKKSSLRSSRLKEIEDVLQCPRLKVKEIHEVRWFAFYDALQTVYRSWNALVRYFAGQPSKDPKAVGLHKKLTQYKFVAVTYFLMDVIPVVTRLNMTFQRDNIDIAALKPTVSMTKQQLQQFKDGTLHGFYADSLAKDLITGSDDSVSLMGHKLLNKSNQEKLVCRVKEAFLNNLIDNIDKRFPSDSTSVVSAFDILAMKDLSFIPHDQLSQYGVDKLEILIAHYGSEKTNRDGANLGPIIETRQEWSVVKQLVLQQAYPRDSFMCLWKLMSNNHKQTIPNLIKLAKIAAVLPVNTAICERGFSAQNKVKTSLRNRLEEPALNRLLTILVEGPPLIDFDAESALAVWRNKKSRLIFSAT